MKVGVPKELFAGDHRVAATPSTAKRLQRLSFEVLVELLTCHVADLEGTNVDQPRDLAKSVTAESSNTSVSCRT